MDAIRTENLTKVFDSLPAVDHLTLSVTEGEIFDSSARTVREDNDHAAADRHHDPTAGEAWVSGHHTVLEAEAIKRKLGHEPRFGLYPDLTVMENIALYADIYGVRARAGSPNRSTAIFQ